MFTLYGPKLSESRVRFYEEQLAVLLPEFSNFKLHYDYFLEVEEILDGRSITDLESLLMASSTANAQENTCFWVVPRLGTASPWGSKTLNVLHASGHDKVKSIEQGLRVEFQSSELDQKLFSKIQAVFFDRMTQEIIMDINQTKDLFKSERPCSFKVVNMLDDGLAALKLIDLEWGLALSDDEMLYLLEQYQALGRNPTDVELMMFSQVNSEHCRHKIFNAKWVVDNQKKEISLFDMIRNTSYQTPANILSAYHDNAAVINGFTVNQLSLDFESKAYQMQAQDLGILIKVETHNHPTAIEPFAGAGTGAGGEIRDEGATGIGSKPKAGLVGFSVSHLHIPGFEQSYENVLKSPDRIASSFDIMQKAPIGSAQYNNEFGRPTICGYFRAFQYDDGETHYGYHKPIMIAGGLGQIQKRHIEKQAFPEGAPIIVLGGPAMKIGLGGGAASSNHSGTISEALDFASVQRQNPEMERRCQEVIDQLWALADNNPILSIHDVGAGGLSNALPELVEGGDCGGVIELRDIFSAEPGLSPLEIWCCEAQERYVLVLKPEGLAHFETIANREKCPFAMVGVTTKEMQLKVYDRLFDNYPVDVPLSLLLSHAPCVLKDVKQQNQEDRPSIKELPLKEAIDSVMAYPTVASKSFLITIGDRSVGGLVHRDQMVGPYQVPVADCGVTLAGFDTFHGEAMAIGERSPIAVLDAKASCAMAVAEAVTNIMGADIQQMSDIKLSCNWMAACGSNTDDKALWDGVEEIGAHLCPALGLAVPVGKDSLSMKTVWRDEHGTFNVKSPLSLVVSAFSPVQDVRLCVTPELANIPSKLLFVDLAKGQQRMGGSCYQQIQNHLSGDTPQVEDPVLITQVFKALQSAKQNKWIKAYHDKSDGGLAATLLEMSFASRLGLEIDLSAMCLGSPLVSLLNEELGCVIQVANQDVSNLMALFEQHDLSAYVHEIGSIRLDQKIRFCLGQDCLYETTRSRAEQNWSQVSFKMQSLRDEPCAAKSAFEMIEEDSVGLYSHVPFKVSAPMIHTQKPRVAILREQGINGQLEMAQAFRVAGFDAIDVTMTDLLMGHMDLSSFQVMAVCGGFSYGDVLGAGKGWANTILHSERLKTSFLQFFERPDTLSLGICNGCQMLSQLKSMIPGASHWPTFLENSSRQFEARLSLVKVASSPSLIFNGMEGAILPIVVSHGEGRATFDESDLVMLERNHLAALHYIDPRDAEHTQLYPFNPNGSTSGVGAVSSMDGRATIMMPHPERVFRAVQMSWCPPQWGEQSPWQQLFYNAARQLD